jgi:hypothetical protein
MKDFTPSIEDDNSNISVKSEENSMFEDILSGESYKEIRISSEFYNLLGIEQ